MAARAVTLRLHDIVEAIGRVEAVVNGLDLAVFETNWGSRWLVERGLQIVSEASRYLPEDLKGRHPQIPWSKVAGIGNILRHDYERIAAPVMWKLVQADLPPLKQVCRDELDKLL